MAPTSKVPEPGNDQIVSSVGKFPIMSVSQDLDTEGPHGELRDSCPFCGGGYDDEFDAREMMVGLRHRFTYRRCRDCQSLWLASVPADLGPYYDASYYSLQADPKGTASMPAASVWTRLLLHLPHQITDRLAGSRGFPNYVPWLRGLDIGFDSRIADVGCGEGVLLYRMSRHGFRNLWGYDPFLERERELGATRLRRGTIGTAEGLFDLIMFNHSLEHVLDPVADLKLAAEHLERSGAIIVRVPVANSYADRHYGADWVSLDPPRHLGVPSPTGMDAAASLAGLRVERVFFDSTPMQFWGSEHYQNDMPLTDERAGCPPGRERELAKRSDKLNREGQGDTAGFVLRHAA